MKNLAMVRPRVVQFNAVAKALILVLGLLFLWRGLPILLQQQEATVSLVDGGLWQLLLFSFISFLVLFFTAMALFSWLLSSLGLPKINTMVSQFKLLTLWQQFVAYWASFALLFAGALLCLAAIF